MSNDKKQPPEAGAAEKDIFLDIFKAFADAAKPETMDGQPATACPLDDMLEKVLDGTTPIEALDKLAAMMSGEDLPEDAESWKGMLDPKALTERFKKVSSLPIFSKLPPEARNEIIGKANEGAAQLEEMMELMRDFAERPEDEQAAIIQQMEEKTRRGLLDDIRQTIAMSTETRDGDAFLYRNLQEDPSSVAVVEGMTKGLVTRAARAAAVPIASGISMSEAMLPPEVKREELKERLEEMTKAAPPETVAALILEAIPQTFEDFKEHAPERAAALETYAREEAVKAFAPLVEYVARIAEPVEEEAPAALQTVPILKRIDGTDKLTQAIFAGKVGRNYVNVAMETAGSAKEVTSAICLLDYDGFTLPNGQPLVLTPFLYEVYNAICSIRAAGNRFTTYNMIYKVMTGKTGRGKSKEVRLNAEKKEQLRKALQILRVGVSTDIHEEVDAGYIKDEKLKGTRFEKLKNAKKRPTYIDDVLLDTRVIGNVEIDGHMMDEVIEIKDEPILYSYSKMRGQVSTYPLEVLNAPIRNTADNMAVRGILIRWILMGDKKKDFYKLNYEKIFEAVGISAADKSSGTNKRRTQIRKCVDDCLIYWKKIKFIHNYEVTRRGMKYLSISVTTPEQIEEWKGKQHKRKAH